jgi:hypothetical protein
MGVVVVDLMGVGREKQLRLHLLGLLSLHAQTLASKCPHLAQAASCEYSKCP